MTQTTKNRWIQAGTISGVLAAGVSLLLFAGVSGADVSSVIPGIIWYFLAALLAGAVLSWLLSTTVQPVKRLEAVALGVIYGVVLWVVFGLLLVPVLAGMGPQWQPDNVAAQFPLLLLYVIQGIFLALTLHTLQAVGYLLPAPIHDHEETREITHRVLILGGGFAGVTTAQELEKRLGEQHGVQITLVSRANHLLFTPMLAEVTAGGVEAQHISPPLRAFFRRVRVIQGEPSAIDAAENAVSVRTSTGVIRTLKYDQLVLALGAVPNFYGSVNIERCAFTFKSLADAIHIRNHVIDMLERADGEPNPERRRALLTFVVVGAGFAGSELIGGLNDFVRGALGYYRHLHNDEITLLLVHPADRILPELSPELAQYAEEQMTARGITILSGARATDASPTSVTVGDQIIPTCTLIWTAGNTPNPLLRTFSLATDQRGAVITDEMLLVHGQSNIWAVGDCAAVPDVITGKNAPPTAQYALREAKTLAYNLHATINGEPLKPFRHRSQGALAVVGHQTAVAEVFGFKFSGLFAWLLWRGIYLGKLPTLEKKLRVLLDWIIDVFFPRDIAYTPLLDVAPDPTPEPTRAVGD